MNAPNLPALHAAVLPVGGIAGAGRLDGSASEAGSSCARMPISRMDLADAGSPEALVKHILQAEPNLPVPMPIQELCARLGILRIKDLNADEFEGGLVTDAKRSEGTILAKRGGEPRRRFTIAHELGHFLMAHHVPDQPGRFLCKSSDLLRITAKEGDQRQRREVEANRFATVMLMPPHLL